MQKDNLCILSTRDIDDTLTAKASDNNITLDSISFIDVQPVQSDALTKKIRLLATESVTAVFTSTNAVSAVAEQIGTVPNWKIFCTGGRTKDMVVKIFGDNAVIGSAKNAFQLAEPIMSFGCAQQVIFFCGDQRLNELSETLKNNSIKTEEIIVYTTVLTPVLIEKNYDSILFFSPSAVHSFFSMNTIPVDVVLFSIGQTTTATIQSYCTNQVITSSWPGTDNLLTCITDFYNKTPKVEGTIS